MTTDDRHLVLIPAYDAGSQLLATVRAAATHWPHVWVVSDGSRDGSDRLLEAHLPALRGVRLLRLAQNRGKGGAIEHGLAEAAQAGFSHVLTMDADGQHPAEAIPAFMTASAASPEAMILGRPIFAADAPLLRVYGRRLSNWCARVETPGCGIGDSLFGFRVYPIAELRAVFGETSWMRRFDFDPEAAVRMCWHGVRCINRPVPVRYLARAEGGVSHFHYVRDNLLLTWMHARLVVTAYLRRRPGRSGSRSGRRHARSRV